MSLVYLIPSGIYDLVISRFLTNLSYERLNKKFLESNPKRILDIGVGTGVPLKHIWNQLPPSCSVLGVDIDGAYVKKAQSIFKNYDLKGRQVEIREQNFYELSPEKEGQFNSIVFSSSFMLMPDREGAIKLAKQLLEKSGYIYFILTLQPDSRKNSFFMNMVEFIKPKIKYFTSIDFGQITFEKEFENLLQGQGLKITHKERLSKSLNIPTKLFRVFVYETKV